MPATPIPTDPEPTTTADTLRRAADGDATAWEEILRRFTPAVLAGMRSFRLQDADREDVMQTVWLRLAENIDKIHSPERVGGWLSTVVTRECLQLRRRGSRVHSAGDDLGRTLPDPAVGPEGAVVRAEGEQLLWDAVEQLPARPRDLVHALFADAPRPYAEIARDTGTPIGSIGPTRLRAMRTLRRILGFSTLGAFQ